MSDYADWIRHQRCCVPECKDLGEPHHYPERGAGGRDCDTTPMCRDHHNEGHMGGWESFQRDHNINLKAIAEVLHEAYLKPRRFTV